MTADLSCTQYSAWQLQAGDQAHAVRAPAGARRGTGPVVWGTGSTGTGRAVQYLAQYHRHRAGCAVPGTISLGCAVPGTISLGCAVPGTISLGCAVPGTISLGCAVPGTKSLPLCRGWAPDTAQQQAVYGVRCIGGRVGGRWNAGGSGQPQSRRPKAAASLCLWTAHGSIAPCTSLHHPSGQAPQPLPTCIIASTTGSTAAPLPQLPLLPVKGG